MQRRPKQEAGLALVAAAALNHERAHWFQFCGSTIGSTVLTLFRAEDVALLSVLAESALEPSTKQYVKDALAKQRPLLGEERTTLPAQLGDLSLTLSTCAMMRSLLLGVMDPARISTQELANLTTRSLRIIEQTYAVHTGGSRDWAAPDPLGDAGRLSDSIERSGVGAPLGLTTRHVFEAGALLNEIGDAFLYSWHWGQAGSDFRSLTRDFEGYVEDRLAAASPVYADCLTRAMRAWQEHFPGLRGLTIANFLARTYPALATCLDIALNPRLGPISALGAKCWAEMSPPHRYLRAVEAVSAANVPDRWPSERDYVEYREAVCAVAGLPYGRLDHRSFQHPRLGGDFFCSVEASDSLLPQTTHFDYLVWAMEGMHGFRGDHALTWAMPRLLSQRQEDGPDPTSSMLNPDYAWSAAPLYWSGRELGIEARISESFGVNLAVQLMGTHMLRQIATRAGSFDLTSSFPEEFLRNDEITEMVLGGLVIRTGFTELRTWEFALPAAGVESPDLPVDSSESARVRPAEITRVNVARADVEALNLDEISVTFARLREDPVHNRFGLDLRFNGYDARPEGLWDIADVRAYVLRVREEFPFWPWYMAISPNPAEFVAPILFFVAGVHDPRRISEDEARAFLTAMFHGLNMEAERVGLSEPELEEMSMDVSDAMNGLVQVRLG